MKKLLFALSVFFSIMAITFASAGSIRRSHIPRIGDRMVLEKINYSMQCDTGDVCIWDLSMCETVQRLFLSIDSFGDRQGQYVAVLDRKRNYFNIVDDTIFCTGFEKPGEYEIYTSPIIYAVLEDDSTGSRAGIFSGSGELYERTNTCSYGIWICEVVASGTLITPDADTLHNVVRANTHRYVRREYVSRDSVILPPSPDAIYDSIATSYGAFDVIHESRWYAPGYRYPVISCMNIHGNSISYYAPLSEVALLPDPINEEVRELALTQNNNLRTESASRPDKIPIINYTFSQDRNSRNVSVNYSVSTDCFVEFILADVSGIMYK
ncbi:MAG: hypothetical protein K2G01_02190, partial [Paramuribaculum sp.]|nr:hypothetical protein [Paramuribaculum sp.]